MQFVGSAFYKMCIMWRESIIVCIGVLKLPTLAAGI